jgi:hypothetical protein
MGKLIFHYLPNLYVDESEAGSASHIFSSPRLKFYIFQPPLLFMTCRQPLFTIPKRSRCKPANFDAGGRHSTQARKALLSERRFPSQAELAHTTGWFNIQPTYEASFS